MENFNFASDAMEKEFWNIGFWEDSIKLTVDEVINRDKRTLDFCTKNNYSLL